MIADDPPVSHIMGIVYSCLSSTGVSATVCQYIMEMTTNLLDSEGVNHLLEGELFGNVCLSCAVLPLLVLFLLKVEVVLLFRIQTPSFRF